MHTFLTGDIQIGKTTALNRFLACSGCRAGGFRTHWEDGALCFSLLVPAPGEALVLARRTAHGLQAEEQAFSAAAALLQRQDFAGCSLLCLDELGFLEAGTPDFLNAVYRLLDGPVPVIGALRRKTDGPFWETLHRREDCEIWTLTRENRDEIPQRLLRRYGGGKEGGL